jgi:hypothetical protein
MIRSQQLIRRGTVFLVAAAALASVATAAPSVARSNFDGTWSVSIVTEKGECDRGYRYPIAINNGVLVNGGDTAFDISGKVAANGSIAVRIAYGDKSANGRCRLSGNIGMGSWSGGSCAGTWTAERRNS